MKKGFLYIGMLSAIFLLLHSCANPTYPTGGEKDALPPKLLSVVPKDSTVLFENNEVVFTFDEFVQIQNPIQNVIITPNPKEFPDITARRNNLIVKFKEPLLENTTYTVSFGAALKDNNEGNAYNNLQYVFSTGSVLDSLSLKGNISFIGDKFPQNVFVVMYKDASDSAFLSKRPDYIYRADEKGTFDFKNLQAGKYTLYAIGDKNYNYYYDNPTEEIGFMDSSIILSPDAIKNVSFNFFLPEQEQLLFTEFPRVLSLPLLTAKLNKELDRLSIYRLTCLNQPSLVPDGVLSVDRKVFTIWFPETAAKGNYLFGFFKNDALLDSVNVSYEPDFTKLTPIKLTPTYTNKQNQIVLTPNDSFITFQANLPLTDNEDSAYLYLKIDSLNFTKLAYSVDNQQITTYKTPNGLQFDTVIFYPGTIHAVFGTTNKDTLYFPVKHYSEQDLGVLNIQYNFPDSSLQYLIKVFNSSNAIVLDTIISGVSTMKWHSGFLLPGNYSTQVIFDEDRNGIRSFGSFFTKSLPEPLYIYDKPINLKNNWEFDVDIEVKKVNTKAQKQTDEKTNTSLPKDDEDVFQKR
ncbi:MAG: Ig-like domain-containing protein [Chitinophagales bacterium]|nr:Ig-like domain-containing protein [Chitinophagales bacterium]